MAYYDNTMNSWNALAIGMNALNDARRFELEKQKQKQIWDSTHTGVDSSGNIVNQQAYDQSRQALADTNRYYNGLSLEDILPLSSMKKLGGIFRSGKDKYQQQKYDDLNKQIQGGK